MKNERFILKPVIDMVEGVKIDKKTTFTYENDNVKQKLENLVLNIELKETGETPKSKYEYLSTGKITLDEGVILQFDEDRGYFLPNYELVSVDEALEDIKTLKEFE